MDDDEYDFGPFLIQTSFAKGHLEFARAGRVDSAIYLLLYARDCLRSQRPLPQELAAYLAEAFDHIAIGMDADMALHTRPGRKTGRPPNNNKHSKIAARMLDLIETGKASSQEEAAAIVAEEFGEPTDIKALKGIFRKHREVARVYRNRMKQINKGGKSEN